MPSTPNPEQMPQAMERQRGRVRTELDVLWQQAVRLDEEIDTTVRAGGLAERQFAALAALRLRSLHLAELGEAIDWQRSERVVVDHGRRGKQWRPTAVEPF